MPKMRMNVVLLSLATLCVPAFAQDTNPAVRDSSSFSISVSALNYVQGQAMLDGQPVTENAASAPRPLRVGDLVTTSQGRADVMLVPGTLLRLGDGTAMRLVAEEANRTEVRLESGRANVSVNRVPQDKLLLVDMPAGQVQILQGGLYTFDTASQTMRVYHGEADAFPGADTSTNVKPEKVKEGHEVVLSEGFKPKSFDRADSADLLPWTGPQETQAAIADGAVRSDAGYAPVGYGFYGAPYEYGYGYPLFAGYGYPYGWGGPFGFYGYPFFGFGLGFGGFYGGGFRGGYGVARGGYVGLARGGVAGGGFHGGGFGGGRR